MYEPLAKANRKEEIKTGRSLKKEIKPSQTVIHQMKFMPGAGLNYREKQNVPYRQQSLRDFRRDSSKGTEGTGCSLMSGVNFLLSSAYPVQRSLSGAEISSNYLAEPAAHNGIIIIGAGSKPMIGAYNIDINPSADGVYLGDATALINVPDSSQNMVIIENPYGFDPLNAAIIRVTQIGGTIIITGSSANKYVNKTKKRAAELGLELVNEEAILNDSSNKKTAGESIKSTSLLKYTIRKK